MRFCETNPNYFASKNCIYLFGRQLVLSINLREAIRVRLAGNWLVERLLRHFLQRDSEPIEPLQLLRAAGVDHRQWSIEAVG